MSRRYSIEETMQMLEQAINSIGSQKAFAARHKLSASYLNDVLQGKRDLSGKILTALGLERIVLFERKPGRPKNGDKIT